MKKNKIQLIIFSILIAFVSNCSTMERVDDPSSASKKPGLVMIVFFASQKWDEKILPRALTSMHLGIPGGQKIKSIPNKDLGFAYAGNYRYIFSNLEPGMVYAIKKVEVFDAKQNTEFTINFKNDFAEQLPVSVESGKIKFLGVYAIKNDGDKFEVVDGVEDYHKFKDSYMWLEYFEERVFGKNEKTQLGAYKHMLDEFIVNQKDGYWKEVAEGIRKNLN